MRSVRPARITFAAAACAGLLALTACSGDSDSDAASEPKAQSSDTATAEPDTEPSEEPADDAADEGADEGEAAAGGSQPEWAPETTTVGEKISTVEVGDVTVDIHQVGVAKSPKNGFFADPDTNKPLIAEGDEIVFVNYVITNNGDPIDLGSTLVKVEPKYDDWKWMQGMDSISDSALYEEQGVNSSGLAPGAFKDPSVYTFGSGQTFSYGTNFKYQKNSPITFTVTVIPVDAEGELLHDQRAEGTGTAKIA